MRVEKEIPPCSLAGGTLSEDMRAEPGDEGHAAVWLSVLTDPVEDMGPIGVRVKADGPSIVWLRSHPARQGMRTMARHLASDSNGAFVLADEIALSQPRHGGRRMTPIMPANCPDQPHLAAAGITRSPSPNQSGGCWRPCAHKRCLIAWNGSITHITPLDARHRPAPSCRRPYPLR
ncbi:hypothetical protein [Bifidobacterium breve]|uniref:hypothetical protein n=1 Tax=Bifidobacterium breve TaxID=1685 RepID=UPI001D158278|nr:hypothetical protein [Bifidobacterium breve]